MLTIADLMQFNAYVCLIASILLNSVLIFLIHMERSHENFYRMYNTFFIWSGVANLAMSLGFAVLQPAPITFQSKTYIVFLGPFNFLPDLLLIPIFSIFISISIFQIFKEPAIFILRFIYITRKMKMGAFIFRKLLSLILALSLTLGLANWIILQESTLDIKPDISNIMGEDYGFLAVNNHAMNVLQVGVCSVGVFGFVVGFLIYRSIYERVTQTISIDGRANYQRSIDINQTLLVSAIQQIIFLTLPICLLSIFSIEGFQISMKSMPIYLGTCFYPITNAITTFIHLKYYQRQFRKSGMRCLVKLGYLKKVPNRISTAVETSDLPGSGLPSKMVWLCASTLIQVISIIMFFPSIILNVLLLTAIDYEKKNGNKYEFYNTIFRFTAHTNIAYTILLTILQPILIVSQSSVYVAILGIGSSFPILLKNFLFAIFIGLLTFKNLESPVALGLRYFNIIKKIDISKKFKPVLIVVFLLCVAATLHYFIFIYLQTQDFAPNWDSYQKSISSYTCNINNGFLVMDRIVAYYLFCEAIPLIIGFGFCVIIDIFLARHILRNNDNRSKIGYHESKNLGITLILMNITTVFLQTIPILIFSIFVILKTDVGLRAIPTLLGSYFMPLLSPAIIFYHILPYRIHLYRRFGLLKSQATVGLSQTSI